MIDDRYHPFVFSIPKHVTTVFLSGPMTGYPDWNHALFNNVAMELRILGFTVVNPAEFFGGNTTLNRSDYMRQSIINLLESDMVMLLPGWSKSDGALVEAAVGMELGLEVGELHHNTNLDEVL